MKSAWIGLGLAAAAMAAGCAPRAKPVPPPPPSPPPRVVVTAPPAPPAPVADWPDRPPAPGDWVYTRTTLGSQAVYGPPASEAAFVLRCEEARGQITLSMEGAASSPRLTVRTTTIERTLSATQRIEPLAYLSAVLPASDPLLDAIVFSRGRFAVEAEGPGMLVLPTWPEPARVIEDCRD